MIELSKEKLSSWLRLIGYIIFGTTMSILGMVFVTGRGFLDYGECSKFVNTLICADFVEIVAFGYVLVKYFSKKRLP